MRFSKARCACIALSISLDPATTRDAFLKPLQTAVLLLVVMGGQTPPSSKAEIEAVASLASSQRDRWHEESASEVAALMLPFLRQVVKADTTGLGSLCYSFPTGLSSVV